MAENKIRALFIFEILGRPAEHVTQTLSELVDKIGGNPGIKIHKKTVHEAKPVEKKESSVKDLFTSFAEVEFLIDDLNLLLAIVFQALPSHVEIIEPDELRFKNFDISSMVTDLTTKLHKYDEIAKAVIIEKNILSEKLREAQEKINNFESEKKSPAENKKKKKNE